MADYSPVFGWLAFLLFVVSSSVFWLRVLNDGSVHVLLRSQLLTVLWAGAIVSTGVFTLQRISSHSGYDLSFYNSILITGFLVALIALISSLWTRNQFLAMVVLPLGAICVILNLLFFQNEAAHSSRLSFGIELHALMSITAFSLFGLSAIQALLLYLQERQLKHHQSPRMFAALPSLHENEVSLHHFNVAGFVFLSLALITGLIYIDNIFAQHLVHKTVLSLLAWGVFATLLAGRHYYGWRGITAVRWTLVGFIVLLLAYLGSKLVLEMILNRP